MAGGSFRHSLTPKPKPKTGVLVGLVLGVYLGDRERSSALIICSVGCVGFCKHRMAGNVGVIEEAVEMCSQAEFVLGRSKTASSSPYALLTAR